MRSAGGGRHPVWFWLLLAALSGAVDRPAPLAAQTIDGVLLERGTERWVDLGLLILLNEAGDSVASTLTNSQGRFILRAPAAGNYYMHAAALGYRQSTVGVFELTEGGGLSVEFRLDPIPIDIGGLTVEARSSLLRQPRLIQNGFVERVDRGFGRFITPVDIEEAPERSTAELLARTGRVMLYYDATGPRIRMLGNMGYCTPVLYLDGVRFSLGGTSIDSAIPKDVLEAAEVYRTPSEAPLAYGGGMAGGCGVILLWTKSR